MPKSRVFGWNPGKLCEAYTMEQLVALGEAIRNDPENKNLAGGIYHYNEKARRKLNAVDWAIYHKLCERRPPVGGGYSGRNSNRR